MTMPWRKISSLFWKRNVFLVLNWKLSQTHVSWLQTIFIFTITNVFSLKQNWHHLNCDVSSLLTILFPPWGCFFVLSVHFGQFSLALWFSISYRLTLGRISRNNGCFHWIQTVNFSLIHESNEAASIFHNYLHNQAADLFNIITFQCYCKKFIYEYPT